MSTDSDDKLAIRSLCRGYYLTIHHRRSLSRQIAPETTLKATNNYYLTGEDSDLNPVPDVNYLPATFLKIGEGLHTNSIAHHT